jgi:hypothetical protein
MPALALTPFLLQLALLSPRMGRGPVSQWCSPDGGAQPFGITMGSPDESGSRRRARDASNGSTPSGDIHTNPHHPQNPHEWFVKSRSPLLDERLIAPQVVPPSRSLLLQATQCPLRSTS